MIDFFFGGYTITQKIRFLHVWDEWVRKQAESSEHPFSEGES